MAVDPHSRPHIGTIDRATSGMSGRSPAKIEGMPTLPMLDGSLLVRTDFSNDAEWQQLTDDVQRENEDGFRAYVEPVNDPAFDGASWEAVKAAVPANENGAAVLFIADVRTMSSPDRPIVVVDLVDDGGKTPFRSIPSELWSIDNNLNIANMDWEEFAGAADEDGVFRGFDG
jgi:hypothetical protein